MAEEAFNLAGDKIGEVLTPEEMEEQKRQEVEKARASWESQSVEERDEKISTLESELEKLKEKEINFSNLRDKTRTQEEEQNKNKTKIDELESKLEQSKSELKDFVVGDYRNNLIDEVAMGDAEVKKAIEENFKRIAGPEDTKEQVLNKVKEAAGMTAAQAGMIGQDIVDSTSILFSGGSSGKSVANGSVGEMSPEVKDMARSRFGITDKVLKEVEEFKKKNNY